jgi:predicted nucleotidyltransferase
MRLSDDTVQELKKYFISRPDICFAFLFGSYAYGKAGVPSDVDIAVYFYPKGKRIEWEEADYWNSSMLKLWVEIEDIVGIDVDLVILNLVNSLVASSAIRGRPFVIKNDDIFLRFSSIVDEEVEDRTYEFIKEIRAMELCPR